MATMEQLEAALRKAHEAGNTADARRFAAAIKNFNPEVASAQERYVDQVRSQFAALPWYKQAGQAVDDALRLGSNALTLDARDKYANMIGGDTPEMERQKTQDARIRAGSATLPLEVLPQLVLLKRVPGLAPAALSANPTAGPITRAMISGMAGASEGGAMGVINAANRDEDVSDGAVTGALQGIGSQAVAGLLSKGLNKIDDFLFPSPHRMSPGQLRQAKDRAYQDVEDLGVEYTPRAIDRLNADIEGAVQGAWPGTHDQAIRAARNTTRNLRGDPNQPRRSRSIDQVDKARQGIYLNVSRLADPDKRATADFGLDMEEAIDDWMRGATARDVTSRSGSPEEGIDALMNARDLNSRMRKSEQLTESLNSAERRADMNLQSGVDSTIKQNINSIMESPKRSRGYTPDERGKMDEVVRGTPGQKVARQVGRLAPGGGLSWQGAGGAATIAGLLSGGNPGVMAAAAALPPAVGFVSKKLSERGTKRSMDELLDLVASGGNAAAIRRPPVLDRETQELLSRLLTVQGVRAD